MSVVNTLTDFTPSCQANILQFCYEVCLTGMHFFLQIKLHSFNTKTICLISHLEFKKLVFPLKSVASLIWEKTFPISEGIAMSAPQSFALSPTFDREFFQKCAKFSSFCFLVRWCCPWWGGDCGNDLQSLFLWALPMICRPALPAEVDPY